MNEQIRFLNSGIKVYSKNPDIKRYATMLVKQPLMNDMGYKAWVFKTHENQTTDFVWQYDHTDEKSCLWHFAYILKDHFEMWHLPD